MAVTDLRLVLGLVLSLVLGVAGCTAPPLPNDTPTPTTRTTAPPPPNDKPAPLARSTAPVATRTDVHDLLLDSWVVDGSGRYFVDRTWSVAGSPFSVYETYWQVRARNGVLPAGMDRTRLALWVRHASVGAVDQSLQRLGEMMFASGIASRIGLRIEPGPVADTLRELRDGYRYAADPGTSGTWGGTAAAVQVMSDLGIRVPDETVRHALAELAGLPGHLDAPAIVATALPLLEIYVSAGQPDQFRADALRAVAASTEGLRAIPPDGVDVSWLGAAYQLEQVRAALGLVPDKADPRICRRLVGQWGTVTVPGNTASDTQGTFYARELSCAGVAAEIVRPYTRAGWVKGTASQPAAAFTATISALRLAAQAGYGSEFVTAGLRSTVDAWWRPLAADPAMSGAARLVAGARLRYLEGLLGAVGADAVDVGAAADSRFVGLVAAIPFGTAAVTRTATAALPDLVELDTRARASIDVAAQLALAGRLLNRPDLAAKAAVLTSRLRIVDGRYAATECATGGHDCDDATTSIAASAIGSWIDGLAFAPQGRWACAGLVCSDMQDDGLSLRGVYLALACSAPACGSEFPFVL